MGDEQKPKKPDDEVRQLRRRIRQLEEQLAERQGAALCSIEDLHRFRRAESNDDSTNDESGPGVRGSHAKCLQLFEKAFEGVVLVQDDQLSYVNKAAERMIGRSSEELLSQPFADFVHPEDRDLVTENNRKRRLGEPAPGTYEFRIVTADGSERWLEITALLINFAAKPAILAFLNDLTERQRAERELRCTQFAVDTSAYAVYRITGDGSITYCNDAAARTTGYTKEELLSMRAADLDAIAPIKTLTWIWKQAKAGKSMTVDSQHRRKDGSTFPVEVTTSFFEYSGEEYCFAFVQDVSDRKKVEEEWSRMETHLAQQQKIEAIGTLAGGVAHEINNPINIVMNYAELITTRCDADEQTSSFAREITTESQRIATIVRNLLAFAREGHEVQQLTPISDVIESSLALMREVLRKRQINLIVDIEDGLPKVDCRLQQIQQVLMNLITNSRDALAERDPDIQGDKTIKVTARRIEKGGRHWIRTTVEDNGPGIPEELVDRVFEPFFTSKPRDRGTGLGLSVSHGIVRKHGGELLLETEESKYSRFHVDLPLDEEG